MTPLVLSALVCPGAGQFLQRRWVSAVVFTIAFALAFVWFAVNFLVTLKAYYEFATDFSGASGKSPGVAGIGLPFLVCLLLYLAGLVDTAIGNRRPRPPRTSGDDRG